MTEVQTATHEAEGLDRSTIAAIAVTVTAALVRLVPLQWLHPLQWDELEFFRATRWIAQGQVPFRDFWEHHTPLTWIVFAPATWLSDSPGVGAVIGLRWVQVLVWVLAFYLLNEWMRGAGIGRFARWSAMALATASSMFMIPAIEYRVDSVACALFMAGLVLSQRQRHFSAGILFCLVAFANLRFGPLLVAAALTIRMRHGLRANRLFLGGVITLLICLGLFAATGSLDDLYRQVWVDNLAEKYAVATTGGFFHRLLVPFGVRVIGSERLFHPAAVDLGGVAVILFGAAGLVRALLRRNENRDLFILAIMQLVSVLFIASMKFAFNYHFLIVVLLMVPLLAAIVERVPPRAALVVLAAALAVSIFASLFRGKELDRAYQDLVMREVHSRTHPGEHVWSGLPWAIRRQSSYRFWFLPELARQLVQHRQAQPYLLAQLVLDPPAAVVFDHNALMWVARVQPELGPYLVRHYIPLWRELWVPGMNVRLRPGSKPFEFVVPRDGNYRIHASHELAQHLWFRDPLAVASRKDEEAAGFAITLPPPRSAPELQWWVDRKVVSAGTSLILRKGQRVAVATRGAEPIAVILLPGSDAVLFRSPPPGVSLEAEATRVTHFPRLGAKIEP